MLRFRFIDLKFQLGFYFYALVDIVRICLAFNYVDYMYVYYIYIFCIYYYYDIFTLYTIVRLSAQLSSVLLLLLINGFRYLFNSNTN